MLDKPFTGDLENGQAAHDSRGRRLQPHGSSSTRALARHQLRSLKLFQEELNKRRKQGF
jgi:hypothetical protein